MQIIASCVVGNEIVFHTIHFATYAVISYHEKPHKTTSMCIKRIATE